jgi:hypothetical protein
MLPNQLRIDVENTKTTFKVFEDNSFTNYTYEDKYTENGTLYQEVVDIKYIKNSSWILTGTEYTKIYDGTKLMRSNQRVVNSTIDKTNNKTTIYRYSYFKDNILIIDTYLFNGNTKDIELFPIEHKIDVFNAQDKILVYEVNDLSYLGETTKDLISPMSFGHNMKVEWEEGEYYSRIYKYSGKEIGKLEIKYRINEDIFTKKVRLFDPSSLLDGLTAYYKMDDSAGNLIDAQSTFNLTKESNPIYSQDGKIVDSIKVGQYSGSFIGDITTTSEDTNTIVVWFKAINHGTGITFVGNSAYPTSKAGMRVGYDNATLNCQTNDAAYGPSANFAWTADTNWHMLICMWNSTTIHQYFDGVFKANGTWDGRSLKENGNSMAIGRDGHGFVWSGNYTIDEVGIWNRTLTLSEISELNNSGLGRTYPFSSSTKTITNTLISPQNYVNWTNTTIPLVINSTVSGTITLSNVTLYVWWSNGTLFFTDTDSLSGTSEQTTWTKTLNNGTYLWNGLSASNESETDWDSNRTINITSLTTHYDINTTVTSGTAFEFYPDNKTHKGVVPTNQSTSKGVITVHNNLSIDGKLVLKLNETSLNITVKTGNSSNYSNSTVVTDIYSVVYSNLSRSTTRYIWIWADYNYTQWKDWFPELEVKLEAI